MKTTHIKAKYRFTCLCAGVLFCLFLAGCNSAPPHTSSGSRDALAKLTALSNLTVQFVDAINDVRNLDDIAHIPARPNMTVSGWAIDAPNAQLASAVWVDLDGNLYKAEYGLKRPDVSAALKSPAYEASGFRATIPGSDITRGPHGLTLRIVNHDGSGYYTGRTVQFDYR